MEQLEYSRLYTYEQAAHAIGVSVSWAERHIGNAIKAGMCLNLGTEHTPKVTGADVKRICMRRWAELETEHRWRAFERVQSREAAELEERGAA